MPDVFDPPLTCERCDQPMNMGERRIAFCMHCRCTLTGDQLPDSILMHEDCRKPLIATIGGGSICVACDCHPTMQDTYLQRRRAR